METQRLLPALRYYRFALQTPSCRLRYAPRKDIESCRTRRWPAYHRPYSQQSSPIQPQTLSQRFKKLSREYGWSAFGVYMLLSALDFPFCFLAVRSLGVDRIGHAEKVVVGYVGDVLPESVKNAYLELSNLIKTVVRPNRKQGEPKNQPQLEVAETPAGAIPAFGLPQAQDEHGVLQAERENTGDNASMISFTRLHSTKFTGIWTQLALAYAIHKSFIFVRIPLTIAVTPKVVKTLRAWGWNIGKAKS